MEKDLWSGSYCSNCLLGIWEDKYWMTWTNKWILAQGNKVLQDLKEVCGLHYGTYYKLTFGWESLLKSG